MKATFEQTVNEVKTIISKHRLISDRVNELNKKGYVINECPMGSGGVGQIKTLTNEVRIQIGFGHGKYNYAKCVTIKK